MATSAKRKRSEIEQLETMMMVVNKRMHASAKQSAITSLFAKK
jgi:hypothetical protein